jgi:lysophospholipase L1-like esterase
MQKNQLTQSLWLMLVIIVVLLAISLLPAGNRELFLFKKVNLLSDIQRKEIIQDSTLAIVAQDSLPASDTVITEPTPKPIVEAPSNESPCPNGKTCLEDFSKNKDVMKVFFQALNKVNRNPVRIAFFGDSFIEGDVLCGSFRDTLQSLYGGRGVGFVPITSEVTQFRTTIQHSFSNWVTYSMVGKQSPNAPLGISGHSFVPLEQNELEYKPGRKQLTNKFGIIRLFYINRKASSLALTLNDTILSNTDLVQSETLQQEVIEGKNLKSIKLQFQNPDSLLVYGVSFENGPGVYVDNFSMRGNSGMGLSSISEELLQQFNQYQDYKLILLQYGLNLVTENDSMNYHAYQIRMIKVVNRLKGIFPKASIVLIGISDRGGNVDGEIKTLPAIPRMRDAQREIARKTNIAFWDLYSAMGGENSIVKLTSAKPPLAAKDYTHLNFRGGRKLAKKLADALLYQENRYD